ncbi:MAG: hypothetical protein V4530_15625 [Pseudomonadota bacterium]
MMPLLLAIICFPLSAYAAWTLIDAFRSGEIEPFTRGLSISVKRAERPAWFWVAALWNAALAATLLFCAFKLI